MKDRRKMHQDVSPWYTPGHMPKTTLIGSLFVLIITIVFLGYRYSVINWQVPRFIQTPVEIQPETTPIPPQETRNAFDAAEWQEWHKTFNEINAKVSQANQALRDAMPATDAERKRYKTDAAYGKEVDRKISEASEKINQTWRLRGEHKAKKPPFPSTP